MSFVLFEKKPSSSFSVDLAYWPKAVAHLLHLSPSPLSASAQMVGLLPLLLLLPSLSLGLGLECHSLHPGLRGISLSFPVAADLFPSPAPPLLGYPSERTNRLCSLSLSD